MGVQNLVDHATTRPTASGGLLASFTIVMFAFGGIEIMGITAEAKNPKTVIPKAINSVPIRILLFYVLTVGAIMCIQPWVDITGEASPFVSIFESLGFQAAAAVFNVVFLIAALSEMNADIYGAGGMLCGFAEQGQAPKAFTRTTRNGVPVLTVAAMVVALLVGVVLHFFFPNQVLFLLGALATIATVLVWLVILVSHIRMKREIVRDGRLLSEFPEPLWTAASHVTVGIILFVIVMVGVVPWSRPTLWVGLVWIAILGFCYFGFMRGEERKPIHGLLGQRLPQHSARQSWV